MTPSEPRFSRRRSFSARESTRLFSVIMVWLVAMALACAVLGPECLP